jgi:hypothetical protein
MKSSLRLLALPLILVASAFAADTQPASPATAYPLKTCIVSDDELGGMGKPVEYVHKEAGKPDRVVLLCCKDCIADFKKEPAKYLAKLDAAAAAAAAKK